MTILFVFTFVFGALRLISFTKLFEYKIESFIQAISPFKLNEFWAYLNKLVFFGCLCYQTYFWFSIFNII
jgi:hypothetical protein